MTPFDIGLLITFILLLAVIFGIVVPVSIARKKYKDFVIAHSIALKELEEINGRYIFKNVPNCDMSHSYDNENFYDEISCKDYLTYQLVYSQRNIKAALKNALDNNVLFEAYKIEIKNTVTMDQYDVEELLPNRDRLKKFERKLFEKQIQTPVISFWINVRLTLTNINGVYKDSKSKTFYPKEIKDIIFKLNQKQGNFYLNNEIWQALCRVERGKVTNKMRFAIYERDHHRCRKCGRRTGDLEIDHIIPIAKGGKSEYSNLQTLCHRCNYKKGSKIEF